MTQTQSNLQQEWLALHSSYEQSEHMSLFIKGFNLSVFIVLVIFQQPLLLSLSIIALVWVLEAIWKTFQSRTEARLLLLESLMRDELDDAQAFQFYSQWSEQRPNSKDLVHDYVTQAMRPTVAFPHAALLLLCLFI